MSSSAVSAVGNFMKSPLVSWAKTFQDEEKKILEYRGLCDGVFLYNLWLEIDPHPPYHGINTSTEDLAARIRNLDVLIHNIKAFYEEVLGQLLLIKVPDILKLAKHHEEHSSVGEMETLLLLILGCAVQCERKEHFIEIIKSMDLEIQHKIVDYIQQITDNPSTVWTNEWNELNLVPPEDQEHMYSLLIQHLRRLVREKDELSQKVIHTALQNLCLTSGSNPLSPSSTSSMDKSHLIVELADVKAKLRKLQQEVEEKNEGITELKEELEKSKESQSKLRQENLELIQDARTAKTYRDEIDILKERVRKVDRLESEIQRYKDKMNELDFYKSRVEELREDNRILVETKSMLEEQLEASRKRAEQVVELESEILKYCSQINELHIERDADREKIQQLLEENAQLHIERKASMEELVQLQSELSHAFTHTSPLENHSLMEQLNTDAQTRVLQLELENQRLRMLVESLNRSPSFEFTDSESMKDMEEYMNNLDLTGFKNVGNAENIGNLKKEHKTLKEKNNNLEKELAELKLTIKRLSNYEAQCTELEKIIADLRDTIKKQQEEIVKAEQLEHNLSSATTENQKLQRIIDTNQQRIKDLQQDLQSTETENQKLNNNVESLKLSVRKYHDLERETTNLETINHRLEQEMKGLEKENNRLKTAIESKDVTIEEYASRVACLDRENKQLVKEVENLNQVATKVKELERENKDLGQQVAVEKKSLEALRQDLVSEKISNQKLNNEIQKVKSRIECNESPPEIITSDPEIQQNELRAADRFLCEKDQKSDELSFYPNFNIKNNSHFQKESSVKELDLLLNEPSDVSASISKKKLDDSPEIKNKSTNKKFGSEKEELGLLSLREELQELKADVIELEKRKLSIEEDNCNLNNQVSSLKDQNNNLKSQLESAEQHLSSVLSQNSSLQSKLAKLEVEITLISSQNKTLTSQNSLFQTQVSNLEEQIKKANEQYAELESRNRWLATDHDSLQRLHEQLTNDYDCLVKIHSSLKSHHKNLKVEHNSLKEKLQAALFSQEEVMRLREVLEEDDARAERGLLNSLRSDHMQLKEQLKSLRDTHEGVSKELKSLQAIHKSLKTENNELKLKHTAMQGELLECQNETSTLDVEVSKLTSCCELLSQKNSLLEEEQQSLMSHVSVLLSQYHELLYQIVSENGQFRKEENSFREKLRELCQQKEKLEQKIMDHCNKLQKSPKRRTSGGSLRMRRTRSAFLRSSKHDPLSSQSDNSTDSSLYCSLRRTNKSLAWPHKNRANLLNPEDSCQEDHIPVRDVGLSVQKDGNGEQNILLSSNKDPISSEIMDQTGHTTLENNMTLNFITNLTNTDVLGQQFSRSASSQQMSPYIGRHRNVDNTFQPLPFLPSSNDVTRCSQVTNKPPRPLSAYCSDTNSNIDNTEASKISRTKTDRNNDQNSLRNMSKEKSLENSVWYEYGCV